VEVVKRRCLELSYPLLEEFDYRHETEEDELRYLLPIELLPTTVIRSYQEKSLSKMFGDGRAHSGC
jgi:DNA excision repair protein ERCC-3